MLKYGKEINMKCIYCGSEDNKVLDSRNSDNSIRRRRECNSCGRRFTTHETIEKIPFSVVKRDGSRQSYDPIKLRDGIVQACKKRHVNKEQIDNIINDIELTVQNRNLQEVKSSTIGEMILKALKDIDIISYIRYASVFKNFQNLDDFKNFINNL